MITGTNGQIPEDLADIGFDMVNSFKLLGFDVSWNLDNLTTNTGKISLKLISIANYWRRFNLSLPGRISIAKTFMYAQIGYVCSILSPTQEQINNYRSIIFSYVNCRAPVAQDRIASPCEVGGLGLFDICDYITSLQASWVKRAYVRTHDNWSYDINKATAGNPLVLHPTVINQETNPVLHTIAISWKKFISEFYKQNKNISKAFLLNNPIIHRSGDDRGILTENLFAQNPPIPKTELAKLKIDQIWCNNRMKPFHTVANITSVPLSLNNYMRLGTALTNYHNRLSREQPAINQSISIDHYLVRFKKGSKPIRNILQKPKTDKQQKKLPNYFRTFFRITGLDMPETEQLKHFSMSWQMTCLPNRLKDFTFQLIYNKLAVRNRLSHMVVDNPIDRACTFCTIAKQLPAPEETFIHLFWDCTTTSVLLNKLISNFIPELNALGDNELKSFVLTGLAQTRYPIITQVTRIIFLYLIWDMHQKKGYGTGKPSK